MSTNPSPSLPNAMKRNSEEGLPITKKRNTKPVKKKCVDAIAPTRTSDYSGLFQTIA